jgi:hypothetical protein
MMRMKGALYSCVPQKATLQSITLRNPKRVRVELIVPFLVFSKALKAQISEACDAEPRQRATECCAQDRFPSK